MAKKRKASSNMQEVQNAAKTLFANIRFMSPDCPLRTIVMTSSVPNEGKSITSIELAKALSLFRQKAHNVTSDSRTRTQLFDSMRELSDAYDAAMEVISEKLKDCVRGR